jgi:hypothetical protein
VSGFFVCGMIWFTEDGICGYTSVIAALWACFSFAMYTAIWH